MHRLRIYKTCCEWCNIKRRKKQRLVEAHLLVPFFVATNWHRPILNIPFDSFTLPATPPSALKSRTIGQWADRVIMTSLPSAQPIHYAFQGCPMACNRGHRKSQITTVVRVLKEILCD
jgi:hypothetical protein